MKTMGPFRGQCCMRLVMVKSDVQDAAERVQWTGQDCCFHAAVAEIHFEIGICG